MGNVEMQLVSRIVRAGEIQRVLEWGISNGDFRTAEAKALFDIICSYYVDTQTRGTAIGPTLFQERFPQVHLIDDIGVTTDTLCHEVRNQRVIGESKGVGLELVENAEVDPAAALGIAHVHIQKLLALGTTKNTDMCIGEAVQRLQQKHKLMKQGVSFAKVSWPWEALNEATNGGIQEDDYIVLYGRPKSMKTFVLAHLIAHVFDQGKTALIYTKEMTQDNIFQRAIACIGQLPYQELRSGNLTPEEEETLERIAAFTADPQCMSNLTCLSGRDAEGRDTVSWLHAKAEKYKPDIIFIDGMYLMSDERSTKKTQDWQRVTNISRAVRDMVLALKTPAVCTVQANRAAAKHGNANLDEIAYADAIAQDATVAMRVINEKASPTIALVMAGSREFKLHGVRIHGVPCTNFSQKEKMSEKDIRKAQDNDTAEESDDPDVHAKARTPKKAIRSNGSNGTIGGAVVDDETKRLIDAQIRGVM